MELRIRDNDGNSYEVSSMKQSKDCLVLVVERKKEKKEGSHWHKADDYYNTLR